MSETTNHSERAHALLSASSAHRWMNCPPSAVAAAAYPNTSTEFTREGTTAHEVAEIVVRERLAGRHPTLDNFAGWPDGTDAEMVEHAHGYADYIQELTRSADALILLEQRVDFSPWVPRGFGTADCIIIQGATMDVIDYKYGKGVAVSAVDNPQEMCYGLGALNDYGFAYDVQLVRLHIYQPRINNVSTDELAEADLLSWGEKLKQTATQAAEGKGKYNPGAWCKFCPHAGRCRALTKVCSEYVEAHGVKVRVPVLAPHEVAEVLNMEPLVSLWLKRVRDQALAGMLNGEQVPGYKVVEGKPGNRKWADELEVAKVLDAAGYTRDEYTETKLLSPAAMDKALGKKKAAQLLTDLTKRDPGAPTIALESDKRQAYNPADDFDNLEAKK
jgi:hypothetical protein